MGAYTVITLLSSPLIGCCIILKVQFVKFSLTYNFYFGKSLIYYYILYIIYYYIIIIIIYLFRVHGMKKSRQVGFLKKL